MKRSIFLGSIAAATLLLSACSGDKTGDGNASETAAAPDGELVNQVVKTKEGGYLMGDPDAPVRLTEYGSLVCVHCRDFERQAFGEIKELVSEGKISFEFRNFLLGVHDIAPTVLSRCGGEDRYFPLTDAWYSDWDSQMEKIMTALRDDAFLASLQKMSTAEATVQVAEKTGTIDFFASRGISRDQALSCLSDEKALAEIEALRKRGVEDGVEGTPTFLINGQKVDMQSWPELKSRLVEQGAG